MSLYVWTRALESVASERSRQEMLREEGRFQHTTASPHITNAEKLAILVEEVGEVAQQVLTQPGEELSNDTQGALEELRSELIQVAAVAVAWVEGIDRAA